MQTQPGAQGGEAERLLAARHAGRAAGQWQHLKQQLWTLWQAMTMPTILLPALFVFVWQVCPVCALRALLCNASIPESRANLQCGRRRPTLQAPCSSSMSTA